MASRHPPDTCQVTSGTADLFGEPRKGQREIEYREWRYRPLHRNARAESLTSATCFTCARTGAGPRLGGGGRNGIGRPLAQRLLAAGERVLDHAVGKA